MSILTSTIDFMCLFALVVISILWLLDSNFSILLNFILTYVIIGLLIILIGYEFLGISVLLIYSSGIAIIFIIASMILGTKHIGVLSIDYKRSSNYILYNENDLIFKFLNILFFISLFSTFNFIEENPYNLFMYIMTQTSFSGLLTTGFITYLNDIFVVGLLLYNQFFIHTILSGFLLLISLIGSIYISQNK